MNYLKYDREPTTSTSTQNFYFLRGKYRIHFTLNKKPRIKITEENSIEWIDSDNEPEKAFKMLKQLKVDVINHLKNEFGIDIKIT